MVKHPRTISIAVSSDTIRQTIVGTMYAKIHVIDVRRRTLNDDVDIVESKPIDRQECGEPQDMFSTLNSISFPSINSMSNSLTPIIEDTDDTQYNSPCRQRSRVELQLPSPPYGRTFPAFEKSSSHLALFQSLPPIPRKSHHNQSSSWTNPSLMGLALSSPQHDRDSDVEEDFSFTEYQIDVLTTTLQHFKIWKRYSHLYEFHALIRSVCSISDVPSFPQEDLDSDDEDVDTSSFSMIDALTKYMSSILELSKQYPHVLKELGKFLSISQAKLKFSRPTEDSFPREILRIGDLYEVNGFFEESCETFKTEYYTRDGKYRIKAQCSQSGGKSFLSRFNREISSNIRMFNEYPEFCVQLVDAIADECNLYSVYNHQDYISLSKFIHSTLLTENSVAVILKRVLLIVDALHSCGMAFLDIHPDNFFVRPSADLSFEETISDMKISNFGCCINVKDYAIQSDIYAPNAFYLAPELLTRRIKKVGYVLKSSDVWSIGILTFKLLTGGFPFNGSCRRELLHNIRSSPVSLKGEELSREAKGLITKFLIKDPFKRITAKQALDHPFLRIGEIQQRLRNPSNTIGNYISTGNIHNLQVLETVIQSVLEELGLKREEDEVKYFASRIWKGTSNLSLGWNEFVQIVSSSELFSKSESLAISLALSRKIQGHEG